MELITGKEIVKEISRRIESVESQSEEQVSQTVGALNGVDMKTYNVGYVSALKELYGFFETRV